MRISLLFKGGINMKKVMTALVLGTMVAGGFLFAQIETPADSAMDLEPSVLSKSSGHSFDLAMDLEPSVLSKSSGHSFDLAMDLEPSVLSIISSHSFAQTMYIDPRVLSNIHCHTFALLV